jgi:hypothetical protein
MGNDRGPGPRDIRRRCISRDSSKIRPRSTVMEGLGSNSVRPVVTTDPADLVTTGFPLVKPLAGLDVSAAARPRPSGSPLQCLHH